MSNPYIDAAIEKTPKVSPDAHYLHQARDLINDGNALKNPINYKITETTNTNLDQTLQSFASGGGDERSVIIAALFAPAAANSSILAEKLSLMGSISDRMFTDFTPFSNKMDIPQGYGASQHAQKIGIPQVNTLLGVASGAQMSDALLGDNPDNPCSKFIGMVTGVIDKANNAIGIVTGAVDEAMSTLGDIINDLYGSATTGINRLISRVEGMITPVIEWTEEAIDKLNAEVASALASLGSAVSDVFSGLYDAMDSALAGVNEAIGDMVGAVNSMTDAIVDQAKTAIASTLKALSNMNPCAQEAIIGQLSTPDMSDLLKANMDPKAEIFPIS